MFSRVSKHESVSLVMYDLACVYVIILYIYIERDRYTHISNDFCGEPTHTKTHAANLYS